MKIYNLLFPLLLLTACSDSETVQNTSTEKRAANKEIIQEPATQVVATTVTKASGKLLYNQRCSSCHGSYAEKKAMNVSKIIAGWSKEETLKALQGYQNGTYGGKMKTIMKSQASLLNPEQKDSIADFLLSLKK